MITMAVWQADKVLPHHAAPLYRPGRADTAINFTLKDTAGKAVALSDYRGKFVVISMYADWCGPCLREAEPTRELVDYFLGNQVVWIFISFDRSESDWKASIKKDQFKGVHLWGKPKSETLKSMLRFDNIPYYIWIDKDGKIALDNAPRPSSRNTKKQLKLFVGN